MTPRIRAILLVALALGLISFGLFSTRGKHTNNTDARGRADVEKLFAKGTPGSAYADFVKMNARQSEQEQHLAAHIFGDVLYAREGMNGFPVCGPEFGFGCYHGFMGAFIHEHGVDAVVQLDASCTRGHGPLGLGCFHGIGHGLVSYYGYGILDLNKALAACATLSWNGKYGGCADGAFMEYNLRTMQIDTGAPTRSFSVETHREPCGSVASEFRSSCQFNQAEWWRQSLIGVEGASGRMGEFCAEIEHRDERAACFRGVGYAYAAEFSFDTAKGVAFCEQYAGVSGDGRLWCREGYAWALYATGAKNEALSVCADGVTKSESSRCLQEYLFVIN